MNVGVGGGGVDVLIKGELVLVGPPGMVVSVGERLVEVGPELVDVGETSTDGVNVWVKLSGNGVRHWRRSNVWRLGSNRGDTCDKILINLR